MLRIMWLPLTRVRSFLVAISLAAFLMNVALFAHKYTVTLRTTPAHVIAEKASAGRRNESNGNVTRTYLQVQAPAGHRSYHRQRSPTRGSVLRTDVRNKPGVPEKCSYYKNISSLPYDMENLTEGEYYQKRQEKVNPFNHTFTVKGDSICTNETGLIILVHSSPTHRQHRDAIRQTWGGVARGDQWPDRPNFGLNTSISLGFVLGLHENGTVTQSITHENDLYRDIIQGDFIDDYSNTTLKSTLGLKWTYENCHNALYLLKSDDDMIINLPYLLKLLNKYNISRGILGPYNFGSKVQRVGKWCVPRKLFPFNRYPPYYSGSAYVISFDIVRELYETSEYIPAIHIDDVYVTGILAKIIKARHIRRG